MYIFRISFQEAIAFFAWRSDGDRPFNRIRRALSSRALRPAAFLDARAHVGMSPAASTGSSPETGGRFANLARQPSAGTHAIRPPPSLPPGRFSDRGRILRETNERAKQAREIRGATVPARGRRGAKLWRTMSGCAAGIPLPPSGLSAAIAPITRARFVPPTTCVPFARRRGQSAHDGGRDVGTDLLRDRFDDDRQFFPRSFLSFFSLRCSAAPLVLAWREMNDL